ncbi:MAG: dTDP-glucose pyrophosphorylase [Flavobacteriaceae bacterium]|jgi:UTP-glucose-1-phosphate uridylyltransferase|nr:dTDP-glucose pyrophosphorylase [Flavobacteriaceae bacterium]
MNKISLLILAGGMGSRYKGQKQVDTISQKETLLEFALYDAIQSGVQKFVFIINSKFPKEYKSRLEKILTERKSEFYFLEQKTDNFIPNEFQLKLAKRKKPLGTAHAVLCAKEIINEPFITMNADDFYGKDSFESAVNFIRKTGNSDSKFGTVAFKLKNTLSENGTVSRGICKVENQLLKEVEEFVSIEKSGDEIKGLDKENLISKLNENDFVSMNFWILKPSFFSVIENEFYEFLVENEDLSQREFYLPSVIDKGIHEKKFEVEVHTTNEKWFGLTYPEDKSLVVREIEKLKSEGVYPKNLWNE